jgi:hypothetical protein
MIPLIRSCIVKINGLRWTIRLYTEEGFNALNLKYCDYKAVTVYNEEEHLIIFQTKYFTRNIIRHELVHAFFSSVDTTGKTPNQMEEEACIIIEKYGSRIYNLTNKILWELDVC